MSQTINNFSYTGAILGCKKSPFIPNIDSEYIPIFNLRVTPDRNSNYQNILINNISRSYNKQEYTGNIKSNLGYSDVIANGYSLLNIPTADLRYALRLGTTNYKFLFDNLWESYCFNRIGGNRYNNFCGSIFHATNEDVLTPICVLVTKKDHSRYIKQCMIMGKDFHPDSVKLLVNSKFDVPRGIFPLLRSRYRKLYKTFLLEKGVEIVTVENFDEIFLKLEVPKVLGINGYGEALAKISNDFNIADKEILSYEHNTRNRLQIQD